MNHNSYIKLYSCCIPVRGYNRGIIMDVQRNKYYPIPIALLGLLESEDSILQWKANTQDTQQVLILQEYIDFLIGNDLAFYVEQEEKELFPPLSLQWESPCYISRCIIEFGTIPLNNMRAIINQLNKGLCHTLICVFKDNTSLDSVYKVLNYVKRSYIQSVRVIIDSKSCVEAKVVQKILSEYPQISSVHIFNQNKDCSQNLIFYHKSPLDSICPVLWPEMINCLDHYIESQEYNTCLNRQISIDANGWIKNCPMMLKEFGNIENNSLLSVLQTNSFQILWKINKDSINICMDCEYRYMCSDCRCFITDSTNLYSQPTKCTYNPYICKWQGESGYVPVEECGSYCNGSFLPDEKKIKKINSILWKQ